MPNDGDGQNNLNDAVKALEAKLAASEAKSNELAAKVADFDKKANDAVAAAAAAAAADTEAKKKALENEGNTKALIDVLKNETLAERTKREQLEAKTKELEALAEVGRAARAADDAKINEAIAKLSPEKKAIVERLPDSKSKLELLAVFGANVPAATPHDGSPPPANGVAPSESEYRKMLDTNDASIFKPGTNELRWPELHTKSVESFGKRGSATGMGRMLRMVVGKK